MKATLDEPEIKLPTSITNMDYIPSDKYFE